jgi:hypothetical protein
MATKKLGTTKSTDVLLLTSANLTSEVTGVLPVANGGNGTGSFTDSQILIGQTSGNTLTKAAMSGDVTMTNAGVVAIGAAKVTNAMLAGSIDLTAKVTGVLPTANGGTGVNNAGTITNATATTITGGGTLALGGFTLTVPATGTAALRDVANTFTQALALSLGSGTSLTISSTTDSTSATTGSIISEGGITSKKTVYMSAGCIIESKSNQGLLVGTGGASTAGSTIASSGGTSGNYNGMFFNANASGNGDTGSQLNTAQPTWRMALGGGAAEWNGADSFAIARVAAGGTVTSPTILLKLSSAGAITVGHSGAALGKVESRATSGAQIVAAYDASNYASTTVSSSGAATLATTGTNASITLTPSGTGNVILSKIPRFNGTNSTGAGSSLLGANSPATTLTAPYTWISVITSDGSTAYIPCWK